MPKPLHLGISCGDPGGIGPELFEKSLPFLLNEPNIIWHWYGPLSCLSDQTKALNHPQLNWVSTSQNSFTKAAYDPKNAKVAYEALEACSQAALNGKLDGIITAPICKKSFQLAKLPFSDHTSYLSKLTGATTRMGFYSPRFLLVLDSVHIPLNKVASSLNADHVIQSLVMASHFCQSLEKPTPTIALAGLNPHAGEDGLMGTEEDNILKPALIQAKKQLKNTTVLGPLPADTLFYKAYQGQIDCVVALYHDQGLAPLKMIHFDEAVNVTLGLPFIRSSPDHGTAFDIAYQNKAKPDSFIAACKLAIRLCHKKNT